MNRVSTFPKILVLPVLSWRRTGGLESVTMEIGSTFAAMGWRVKVFSVFDTEPPSQLPGVEVVSLCQYPRWKRSLWHRYFWRPVLARRVCEALVWGGLLIFGHAHLLPLLEHLPNMPNLRRWAWVYGLEVWGGQACRWIAGLNRLDRVVSISAFTADQVIRAGLTTPVDVMPCCVDVSKYTPTSDPARIRRSEILVCGRMAAHERYKGHDLLLECLSLAEKLAGQRLTLRVIGTGNDLDRLHAKARHLNLGEKVIFAGKVSDADLIEAYRHCGVFCMPSRVEQRDKGYWSGEGFGIVYIEAAACGRPVIASTDGGAPETVIQGETGLIVDPRSQEAVARAIAEILRDPVRADAMGQYGRFMVEQKFSKEAFSYNVQQLLLRDLSA